MPQEIFNHHPLRSNYFRHILRHEFSGMLCVSSITIMKTAKKDQAVHSVHTPTPPQVMDPSGHGKQNKNSGRLKDANAKKMQEDLDDRKLAPREEL
jgi:hypothetical protein